MSESSAAHCFHCHLPVPVGFEQSLFYQDSKQSFCCMGCFSIAETIIDSGLDDYYKFRSSVAPKAGELIPQELLIFDDDDILKSFDSVPDGNCQSIELLCENLQCGACGWLIEKHIRQLSHVLKVSTQIAEQTIYLEWDPKNIKLSDILFDLHNLGYPTKPYTQDQIATLSDKQNKSWLKRLGLAGLGMMQVMMYAVALYIGAFDGIDSGHQSFLRWVSFFVATPVLIYSGAPFFTGAFRALKAKQLSMDVPIALALALAYMASIVATLTNSGEVYFDSVTMFVFFLLIGRFLEYRARQKVRQQFNKKDFSANVLVKKIEFDHTQSIPAQKVTKGDRLLIKPGGTIAFDGVICRGASSLNEAMLSGEFMPVNKTLGEQVLAGSINGDKPLEIIVTHLREEGFLHKLQKLQKKALQEKPTITLLADRIASYFVVAILLLAIATYSYWHFADPAQAIWITIAVLVVSCPCALSLATPVALTCGVSSLNARNFLVQDKDFLQSLNTVTDIVLDKTGTLTKGQLSVKSIENHSKSSDEMLLAIIAALESESEHPIAKAFTPYKQDNLVASSLKLYPFAGVSGEINQQIHWFGNANFIKENTQATIESASTNCLYLVAGDQLVATIQLTDTLREQVESSCSQLKLAGKKLHLLSGDPSDEVSLLAEKLGIEHWKNNLKPDDKLAYVKSLSNDDELVKVLTIGDGINDAPAMAISSCSIAMAGASDLTKNQAGSYLLSADISDVVFAINKSQQTNKIIKQNLAWAICYNAFMVPFALLGMIPPYLAAIGMSLSSLVVVINSLRLNPKK